MSSYQHKSGAQKRREKQKRKEETSRGVRTLFDVWKGEGSSEVEETPVEPELQEAEERIVTRQNSAGQSLCLETADDEISLEPMLQPSTQQDVRTVEYIKPRNAGFDIGMSPATPASNEIEEMVRQGHLPHPKQFPYDIDGKSFPCSVLNVKKLNGELTPRRWFVFSAAKNAFFCLPCRLFSYTVQHPSQSTLASASGWGTENKWRKLFDRLPEHEQSVAHKKCYTSWRELERRLGADAGINNLLDRSILSEPNKWKMLLTRILNVIVFLGERGLAFRGTSQRCRRCPQW